MQQEMFEEVIREMPAGKFCRICLAKIPYTDKTVEGYLNDQLCADLCYDYEQVFKKLSGI